MKVLVACEYSGRVRDAFIARGHDALSCDIVPSDRPGPHYLGDVRDILGDGWDLLVGFPPCTHLAGSGARWWPEKIADGRQADALAFVRTLADADIPQIALENPIGALSRLWRKPDQIVHPWWFGDEPYTKATCLWLKGLPLLTATHTKPEHTTSYAHRLYSTQIKLRNLTFQGMADAMAGQWG